MLKTVISSTKTAMLAKSPVRIFILCKMVIALSLSSSVTIEWFCHNSLLAQQWRGSELTWWCWGTFIASTKAVASNIDGFELNLGSDRHRSIDVNAELWATFIIVQWIIKSGLTNGNLPKLTFTIVNLFSQMNSILVTLTVVKGFVQALHFGNSALQLAIHSLCQHVN